jgi:hypothetical protein
MESAVNSLCGHGFWFSVGVSIAHVSRITSAGAGSGAVFLLAGFLLGVRSKNPTPYLLSMRRISGLLLIVGVFIGFWDSAWLLANLPLGVGFRLIPLWKLGTMVGLSAALLWRLIR